MATVFQELTTEDQHSLVRFLWAKELSVKDIPKEMFPVYGGKWPSRKAVHSWVQKSSQGRRDRNGGAEVAETTVKKLVFCGFRRNGKSIGQVY
jgi:hypothetical protein